MIEILVFKTEEQKSDYERRIAHLTKQVERLEKNLDFRENVINRKDTVIEQLFERIAHKDDIIEKLLSKSLES